MKIVRLTAENVKRIRAVEIRPDGNTVVIAGRNGQGKSSVLDSIWYALGGGPAAKETSKPIRDGEVEARVSVDLGDLLVTRTWREDKTTLTVRAADGAKYSSPQSMLDSLVGRLSFDPLEFAQQPAKDQLVTLLGLVELPFDPDKLDAERAGLYEDRTEVGREIRQLEGQIAGIAEVAEVLPPQEISLTELLRQRSDAAAVVASNERLRQDLDSARRELEDLEAEAAKIAGRIAATKAFVERTTFAPEPDVDALDRRIATVDETNHKIRQRNDRASLTEHLETVTAARDNLTTQIDAIDQQKADAIAKAQMPIDGLSFDADGVTYNGVPFKQCSSAEQLRVSVAMAMAVNPQVRVIRISDGSLLDSENLALIEQMADERDFQVWIERVDESGSVGVVIEDGAIKAASA